MTASAPPPEEPVRGQMVLLPTPRPVVIATEKGIDLGHTVPEPDVLAVSRATVKSDSLFFQPGDVHLAIEVVSLDRPFPIDIEIPQVTW